MILSAAFLIELQALTQIFNTKTHSANIKRIGTRSGLVPNNGRNALFTLCVCLSCSKALALASTCVGGNFTPAVTAAARKGQMRSGLGLVGAECSRHTFEPLKDAVRSMRGAAPLSAKLPKMPAILIAWDVQRRSSVRGGM
jgi:hypothetical protein